MVFFGEPWYLTYGKRRTHMDLSPNAMSSAVPVDPFMTGPRSAIEIIGAIRKVGKAYETEGAARNRDFYRTVENDLQELFERLPSEPGGFGLQDAVRDLMRKGKSMFPTAGSSRAPYEGDLANDAVETLWNMRLGLEAASSRREELRDDRAHDDVPRPVF
jgi:hypothetical protein